MSVPLYFVNDKYLELLGYSSYAEYNEKEFESSLKEMGIYPDIRYQAKEYTSFRYTDKILRRQLYY